MPTASQNGIIHIVIFISLNQIFGAHFFRGFVLCSRWASNLHCSPAAASVVSSSFTSQFHARYAHACNYTRCTSTESPWQSRNLCALAAYLIAIIVLCWAELCCFFSFVANILIRSFCFHFEIAATDSPSAECRTRVSWLWLVDLLLAVIVIVVFIVSQTPAQEQQQ